jgi:hypothetical protein
MMYPMLAASIAAALLATGCGGEKGAAPANNGSGNTAPVAIPDDLEVPSEEEIEQQVQDTITPETADEEFERLRREIEGD